MLKLRTILLSINSLGAVALMAFWGAQQGSAQVAVKCNLANGPFCNSMISAPPEWKGPLFKLSQDYPEKALPDNVPWTDIDPAWEPDKYAMAVLSYFYEGNIRSDVEQSFKPELNPVRRWYHAPWLDAGPNGREPIQGLTRERSSRPLELGADQKSLWNNWAVGFYNAPGGVTIGQVWADHGKPNPALASMPEGTVAAKLLFTTANETEVPFLRGAPEWRAFIYEDVHADSHQLSDARETLPVRLLQIDFAVKDSKHSPVTGWIFGTFVYGGAKVTTGSGWQNVAPVGLMWGNDPDYSGTGEIREQRLNSHVQLVHYGYQGRLNGPVDNPRSSCLSCHATAEVTQGDLLPASGSTPEQIARFFRNVPSGQPFTAGAISTDYSLQLSIGIKAFSESQAAKTLSPAKWKLYLQQLRARSERPARDGGEF